MSHIRTDSEYREARARLERAVVNERREAEQLAALSLSRQEVETALAPGRAVLAQIESEIAWYERARHFASEVY